MNHFEIGNPISSYSMSHHELETELSEQPSFWKRLQHFWTIWRYLYCYRTTIISKYEAVARKHFGSDIPGLNDLAKNVSLQLVTQQRTISYARPNVPKVIEIGGFHVSKKSTSLPKVFSAFQIYCIRLIFILFEPTQIQLDRYCNGLKGTMQFSILLKILKIKWLKTHLYTGTWAIFGRS